MILVSILLRIIATSSDNIHFFYLSYVNPNYNRFYSVMLLKKENQN